MKYGYLLVGLLTVLVVGCDNSQTATDPPSGEPESTAKDSTPMEVDWPFDSPENLAVITLDRIMNGQNPILYVTHDADDGGWQFLDGGDVSEENAIVVSLREVANHDPTTKLLADLPIGWYAVRDGIGEPWQRNRSTK